MIALRVGGAAGIKDPRYVVAYAGNPQRGEARDDAAMYGCLSQGERGSLYQTQPLS